jgi:hypothetical protein
LGLNNNFLIIKLGISKKKKKKKGKVIDKELFDLPISKFPGFLLMATLRKSFHQILKNLTKLFYFPYINNILL